MRSSFVHQEEARRHLLSLLRRHGFASTSFRTLDDGFDYLFVDDDACVAYRDTGAAWVAAGPPIAPQERTASVCRAFLGAAARVKRRGCWVDVSQDFVTRAGLRGTIIGEEPLWDARQWQNTLQGARSLRRQLRRAVNKNVTARLLTSAEVRERRPALDALVNRWVASRKMAPLGFLLQLSPFSHDEERLYVLAERHGEAVALLTAAPIYARHGRLIEHIFRDERTPNGTAELCVDRLMRVCVERGEPRVSLGLAPLRGDVPQALRWLGKSGRKFYNAEGLAAFKSRLRPAAWEPRYVAYPKGRTALGALFDTFVACTPRGLSKFALATALAHREIAEPAA